MKKILFVYILFCIFIAHNMQAQRRYAIVEYGTYVVSSNGIKKVPVSGDLFTYYFWENYIVFYFWNESGIIIYNIENGAVSEILWERKNDEVKIIEDSRYFVIFAYEHIYKLDPVSLTVIDKEYVEKLYTYPDIITGPNPKSVKYEKIGGRSMRYTGKNNYVEIDYGPKIKMDGWRGGDIDRYDGYLCHINSESNIYVIEVYEIDHTAEK